MLQRPGRARPLQDVADQPVGVLKKAQSGARGDESVKGYIGAVDQGTTSTRFMVFDKSGRVVCAAQKEHEQIFPKPGWVEHDPLEIQRRTEEVIEEGWRSEDCGLRTWRRLGLPISARRRWCGSGRPGDQ